MKRLALCAAALVAFAALVGLAPTGAGAATAPTLTTNYQFVTGLDHPWDIGFTPDGTMIFTERYGRVKARRPNGQITRVFSPADVLAEGEGGMMGVAVDPNFSSNRYIYVCMTSRRAPGNGDVRVVRVGVDTDWEGRTSRVDIVSGIPRTSGRHSGCRLRWAPDGYLYVGTGDAATGVNPQSGSSLGGKVLRVTRTGAAAPGNNALVGFNPRIYTYGHRNVQGIAIRPATGRVYSVEHGTGCDDEINLLAPGVNMGWDPVPGYDESKPMTDRVKFPSARVARWSSGCPTIAPSGATFLSGRQWKGWNGYLAVAVLKDNHLRIMRVDPGGMISTVAERFRARGVRLRAAVQGTDGALYLATDDDGPNGAIWRVAPS